MSDNYFKLLAGIDFTGKTKEKNGLTYVSWAYAWQILKENFPDADYRVWEREDGRYWFDDGKTAWVKCSVTVMGITHTELLPILNFKNQPIPAESVTSQDAAKSMQRCITKAIARHGTALYVYLGEDLPVELSELKELQDFCTEKIKEKFKLSENAKIKVTEVCKNILPSENGDPKLCEDMDKLKELKKSLLAIRK